MPTCLISVDDVAGIIRAQLGDTLPDELVLGPEAVLEQLGLSSLDVTEVFVAVEELVEDGHEFDAVAASEATTLGDLVAIVNASACAAAAPA